LSLMTGFDCKPTTTSWLRAKLKQERIKIIFRIILFVIRLT
jgi:hypothetical protein